MALIGEAGEAEAGSWRTTRVLCDLTLTCTVATCGDGDAMNGAVSSCMNGERWLHE